jgi:hypothetical protein
MNDNEPLTDYTLYYIPETGAFGLTGGTEIPKRPTVKAAEVQV